MDNELRDDLISTALDGECVDVDALRRALATEDGRKTLAAFVLLRAATAADDVKPVRAGDRFALSAPRTRTGWWIAAARVPAAWAASVALVAIAASFWAGTSLRAPVTTLHVTAPPPPVIAAAQPVVGPPIRMASGNDLPARAARPAEPSRRTLVPPTPTRVLRFVPGVDWTSTPE